MSVRPGSDQKLPDGSAIERDYKTDEKGRKVGYGNWRWVCYDAFKRPKSKKVNLYTKDKTVAISKARKYAKRHASGTFDPWEDPAQRTETMTKAMESFLAWKRGTGAAEATVRTDRGHLKRFSKSFNAGVHVGNVRPSHVECFLDSLGKEEKPASASYRNRVRASLRHFFGWAAKEGMTDSNPVATSAPVRASPVQRDYITTEEYEAIMAAIEKAERSTGKSRAWLKDYIAFGFGTGLRPREQRLLRWSAVRLSEGVFEVGRDHEVKTVNSRRFVPVAGEALAVLQRRKAASADPNGYVFVGAGGTGPVEDRYVAKNIQRFAEDAGIEKNVVPYSLRHGYGTLMIQAGVPAFELAKVMGTSLQMIEKHYGHLDPKRVASHVARVFGSLSEEALKRVGGAG